MIYWELCKILNFDENCGWYKILFDADKLRYHSITTTRSELVLIYNKKLICRQEDITVPVDDRGGIKCDEKRAKILDSFLSSKKAVEHKDDSDTDHSWSPWYYCQKNLEKSQDKLKNRERMKTTQTVSLLMVARKNLT